MKSHRLWINAGIITTLIVLGTAGTVKAQTVSVVQTNADQSALLQSEPSVAFSVQGDLPFSIHVDDSIRYQKIVFGIKKWMVSALRLPIHPLG